MPAPAAQPVAVQIGAGKIGRGFLGELLHAAGYHVVFVDIDRRRVDAINQRGAYSVHHVTTTSDESVVIDDISALDARDLPAVAEAIAGASLVSTAVGVRNLKNVAPALAAGLARRLARPGSDPLSIIPCENLMSAGRELRNLVWPQMQRRMARGECPVLDEAAFDARFGFVETVISRMIPAPAAPDRSDPLRVACEPYARLPVGASMFRGPLPRLPGLEPVANILAHQRRKLWSHNMSHAVCAYLGCRTGHEFAWQAIEDPDIERAVRGAMRETGQALCSRFGFDPAAQQAYEADLLERYRNRRLNDPLRRVAADPLRKLGPEDRLIGSARLCIEEGVDPAHLLVGIRAAIQYNDPDDAGAVRLQEMLATRGREAVLRDVCGLATDEPLFARLRE